jgi:hypothetical protein
MLFGRYVVVHLFGKRVNLGLSAELAAGRGVSHLDNAQLPADQPQHANADRNFLLRKNVDLQIQMISALRDPRHLILFDQYKRRKQYAFSRNNQGQQNKRIRIENRQAPKFAAVHNYPGGKPEQMQEDKRNTAGEAPDSLGDFFPCRALRAKLVFQFRDCPDILLRYWRSRVDRRWFQCRSIVPRV